MNKHPQAPADPARQRRPIGRLALLLSLALASLLPGCRFGRQLSAPLECGGGASPPPSQQEQTVRVRGRVFSAADSTQIIPGVELVFSASMNTQVPVSYHSLSQQEGAYGVRVRAGRTYQVSVLKDGENLETQELEVPLSPDGAATITKNFYINSPESTAAPAALPSIYFGVNEDQLRPAATAELNRLGQLLQAHPNLRLRITGHADPREAPGGAPADTSAVAAGRRNVILLALAQGRAVAAYDYLRGVGIAESRLRIESHGARRPAAPRDDPQSQQLNRRVAFELLPGEQAAMLGGPDRDEDAAEMSADDEEVGAAATSAEERRRLSFRPGAHHFRRPVRPAASGGGGGAKPLRPAPPEGASAGVGIDSAGVAPTHPAAGRLGKGTMAAKVPPRMTVGQDSMVVLSVVQGYVDTFQPPAGGGGARPHLPGTTITEAALRKSVGGGQRVIVDTADVASTMQAELSFQKDDFLVTPTLPTTKKGINSSRITRWIWHVTPLRKSRGNLVITVRNRASDSLNSENSETQLGPFSIEVSDAPQPLGASAQKVLDFLKSNWEMLSTIVATLTAGWKGWEAWVRRRRRAEALAGHQRPSAPVPTPASPDLT